MSGPSTAASVSQPVVLNPRLPMSVSAVPNQQWVEGKAKAYNNCIAPKTAHRNCSGAGHDTQRAGVGPIGRRLSLRPQTDLWPTAKRMRLLYRLMVSTP